MQQELAEYKRLFNKSDAVVQLQRDFKTASAAYNTKIADLQRQLMNEKAINAKLEEGKLQMTQSLASIETTYKSNFVIIRYIGLYLLIVSVFLPTQISWSKMPSLQSELLLPNLL